MSQSQLQKFTGIAHHTAVARTLITVKRQFQRNEAGLAGGRVDEAPCAVLGLGCGGITGGRITTLNNKRHGFTHDTVENSAVINAAFDQIQKIARCDGGRITIKFQGDCTSARRHLHGRLALKTRTGGLFTTNRCGSGGLKGAAHQQRQAERHG